jgi:hypothetical protein
MLLELVFAQIQAWNRGDLKDFLSYYHEDVKVYSVPAGDLIFASKEALLPHIQPDFDSGKVEQVKIVDQVEAKPYVLLLEEKSNETGTRRAVVTYLIVNGKIKCMWIQKVDNVVNRIPKSATQDLGKCAKALGGG